MGAGGGAAIGSREKHVQHEQPPLLAVLNGEGMSADDAAWAMIADAAAAALTLPGLTHQCHLDLHEMVEACSLAAGLPPSRSPAESVA